MFSALIRDNEFFHTAMSERGTSKIVEILVFKSIRTIRRRSDVIIFNLEQI